MFIVYHYGDKMGFKRSLKVKANPIKEVDNLSGIQILQQIKPVVSYNKLLITSEGDSSILGGWKIGNEEVSTKVALMGFNEFQDFHFLVDLVLFKLQMCSTQCVNLLDKWLLLTVKYTTFWEKINGVVSLEWDIIVRHDCTWKLER